jgi:hypothetical protein
MNMWPVDGMRQEWRVTSRLEILSLPYQSVSATKLCMLVLPQCFSPQLLSDVDPEGTVESLVVWSISHYTRPSVVMPVFYRIFHWW